MKSKLAFFCPFCAPTVENLPLNNTSANYSMLEIKIVGKDCFLRVRNLTSDGLFDGQDMIRINYCPMCGRNLETGAPATTSTGV